MHKSWVDESKMNWGIKVSDLDREKKASTDEQIAIGCLQRIATAMERIADELHGMNPKTVQEEKERAADKAKYKKQKSCDAMASSMFRPFWRVEGRPNQQDNKMKSATESVIWPIVYNFDEVTSETFDPTAFDWESAAKNLNITDLKRSRFMVVLNRWRAAQKI